MTLMSKKDEDAVEVFYVLVGKRYGPLVVAKGLCYNEGTPVSVNFDYDEVYKRQDEVGDVIGFYHTHPNMPAYVSEVDRPTMEGWAQCLGKNLLCLIEGNDGLKAWKFYNKIDFFHQVFTKIYRFKNKFVFFYQGTL